MSSNSKKFKFKRAQYNFRELIDKLYNINCYLSIENPSIYLVYFW